MKLFRLSFILFGTLILNPGVFAQISPGELAEPHAHLEGISNCTKCHELGEKVSDAKCLACHTELKARIDLKKGYHASSKVYRKSCTICHSDHLSKKYDIVHLDKNKFDHQDTGFLLEGKHKEKKCEDCHKAENITDPLIKKKKITFLGLNTACISCHEDRHQKTLSVICTDCHTNEAFKPASKFDHTKSKFPLKGQHKSVECKKCHEIGTLNGKDYQKFKGLQFASCVNCHKDIHDNQFGKNCTECHSEESFKTVKGISTFDHNKTNYKLVGKHSSLSCKTCHKVSLTAPLKHARCSDCHTDYHKGQFTKKGITPDCLDCHTEKGFQGSSFTFERHNTSMFKLDGAHAATPCISCHKKSGEWQFRELGIRCIACHENIHLKTIKEKFIPEGRCENCHKTASWGKVTFDHTTTNFELKGKHLERSCRDCHFKKDNNEKVVQKFSELTGKCDDCHTDVHQKQFTVNGEVNCTTCHGGFDNWKADRFDHSSTRFKLDGGHKGVDCRKCHHENKSALFPFIQYKNTDTKCISCHT